MSDSKLKIGSSYTHKSNAKGIIHFIISLFWMSIMVNLVRYASADYHAFQIVFFRNIFALLALMPFVLLHKDFVKSLHTKKIKLHVVRAIIGVIAMNTWFIGLANMPITNATALSFTAPIFSVIAAIIFLKEKVTIHRWLALIIGFVGMLIIIRPSGEGMSIYAFVVLFSTFLWAVASILIKTLTKTESNLSIIFYLNALMIPASIPLAIMVWKDVNFIGLVLFFFIGVSSNLAQISLAKAFRESEEITILVPFEFTRLIFTGIIAYFAFHEIIDIYTIIGAMVILTSSFYIVRRERQAKMKMIRMESLD